MNFYNDNDCYVAEWLGNLIAAGHLPQGSVDARSIVEIDPEELRSFRQCHFFAGIGGWPYALQLAEWPNDREVWTASCPCQPLSSAGRRAGHADQRHLWPALYRLIAECRPPTIFGEQVASKDGFEWLAGVRADLEAEGYAVGAADLCAAGVGAFHIRQRLFWVAHTAGEGTNGHAGEDGGAWHSSRPEPIDRSQDGTVAHSGRERAWSGGFGAPGSEAGGNQSEGHQRERLRPDADAGCPADARLAEPAISGWSTQPERDARADGRSPPEPGRLCDPGHLGDAEQPRLERHAGDGDWRHQSRWLAPKSQRSIAAPSAWADAEWLVCRDGKARPIEPGTFPLAHGVSARVGRLRAYGNAIVPQVAAEFIASFLGDSVGRRHYNHA